MTQAPTFTATEEQLSAEAQEAFAAGDYNKSYLKLQRRVLLVALRWFQEANVVFQPPPDEADLPPLELMVGLSRAARQVVDNMGDEAPMKVMIAGNLIRTIANLRIGVDTPVPVTPDGVTDKAAELVMLGVGIGQVETAMTYAGLGMFDKLITFEAERERRRAGATVANERKASIREQVLGEAIRIAATNPALSNEDLAQKARDAAGVSVTIKTATGWVREWRRRLELPPIKQGIR